jgi:protein TonB
VPEHEPAHALAEDAPAPAAAAPAAAPSPAAPPAVADLPSAAPSAATARVAPAQAPALAAAPPRPAARNVPAFVLQRALTSQAQPRFSDIFRQSHKGKGRLVPLYRICVGEAGRVTAVEVVRGLGTGDDEVVESIREGWTFRAQASPVCALMPVPIEIK